MRPRFLLVPCAFGLALCGLAPLPAQPVRLDPAFAPRLVNDAPVTSGLTVRTLADGGWLATGNFTHANGSPTAGIVRYLPGGTRDTELYVPPSQRVVDAISLPDGRVLLLTAKAASSTPAGEKILRLNADGTLDATYPALEEPGFVFAQFVPQPDGRILVSGWVNVVTGYFRPGLLRLNRDGTRDPSFAPSPAFASATAFNPSTVAVQSAGKVIVATSGPGDGQHYSLTRLSPDGTADPTFQFQAFPEATSSLEPYHAIAVQADDAFLAATGQQLFRYHPDGALDSSFRPAIPGFRGADKIVALPNGHLLVQARVSLTAALRAPVPSTVVVLGPTGAVVHDFRADLPADAGVELLGLAGPGKVLLRYGLPYVVPDPGDFVPVSVTVELFEPVISRLDLAGHRDSAFSLAPTKSSAVEVRKLVADAGGGVWASGSFTAVDDQPRAGVVHFRSDGTLDRDFVPAPRHPGRLAVSLVQPDGKVVFEESVPATKDRDGLYAFASAFERLLPNGAPDAGFVLTGLLQAMRIHAVDPDGRLLISGFEPDTSSEANLRIAWLNPDGSRAATLPTRFSGFGRHVADGGNPSALMNQVQDVQLLPDGMLLVAVTVAQVNGFASPGVVRLQSDGSIDPSYRPAIQRQPEMEPSVVLLPHGRALATVPSASRVEWSTTRLRPDGSRDPAFVPLPRTIVPATLEDAAGRLYQANGWTRWRADGIDDPDYKMDFQDFRQSISAAVVGDAVYLAGNFAGVNGQPRPGLARMLPAEASAFTVQPTGTTITAGREAVLRASFGTSDATYQWTLNGATVPGATHSALVLSRTRRAQGGEYRVVVTSDGRTFTSNAAALVVLPNNAGRLVNFSARCAVSPEYAPQIAGLVLDSDRARSVLLRGVGEGLPVAGLSLLPRPALRLFQGNQVIGHDDGGALAAPIVDAAHRVGAADLRAVSPAGTPTHDSALLVSLSPGIYTAHVSSADQQSGVSLLELYDGEPDDDLPFATNVSIRGRAAPGADVLIAGFVIAGHTQLRLLIRGIGPGLVPLGVTNAVADPRLMLFKGDRLIASNDNWSSDPATLPGIGDAVRKVGAFPVPGGSADAALLVSLEPGSYSVHGQAVDGSVGEMLIELYVVEN